MQLKEAIQWLFSEVLAMNSSYRQPPFGNASSEYLIVATALMGLWIAFEQSPSGLIQAFKTWHAQFGWAMSIPW